MAKERIKSSGSVAPPNTSLGSSRERWDIGSARVRVESTMHADFAMDTRFRSAAQFLLPVAVAQIDSLLVLAVALQGSGACAVLGLV